jgi:hypothetical protein
VIGAAISVLLPGRLTSAIGVLLTGAGSITGLIFSLMYNRYLGVLAASAKRRGSSERDAYERLRGSLSGAIRRRAYTPIG